MFDIVVVGLGLIGGSVAMALKGFERKGEAARVIGVDADEAVLAKAKAAGAVSLGYLPQDCGSALSGARLVILCVYPTAALEFIERNASSIPPGCVVTDTLGVKGELLERGAKLLPLSHYVGGHPMAGRELSGFDAAIPNLFQNCNYIITPSETATEASLELVRELALHLGASKITYADAVTHDRNIAYTSQLAHVLAAAIVENPVLLETKGFEGGSLADITRVAKLNGKMWSELFVLNRGNLSGAIVQLERALKKFRLLIETGATEELCEELEKSSRSKERWASL